MNEDLAEAYHEMNQLEANLSAARAENRRLREALHFALEKLSDFEDDALKLSPEEVRLRAGNLWLDFDNIKDSLAPAPEPWPPVDIPTADCLGPADVDL